MQRLFRIRRCRSSPSKRLASRRMLRHAKRNKFRQFIDTNRQGNATVSPESGLRTSFAVFPLLSSGICYGALHATCRVENAPEVSCNAGLCRRLSQVGGDGRNRTYGLSASNAMLSQSELHPRNVRNRPSQLQFHAGIFHYSPSVLNLRNADRDSLSYSSPSFGSK